MESLQEIATELRLDNGDMRMGVMTFDDFPKRITHVDYKASSTITGMHRAIRRIVHKGRGM